MAKPVLPKHILDSRRSHSRLIRGSHINKPLVVTELQELFLSSPSSSTEENTEQVVGNEGVEVKADQTILLVEDNEINQLIALEIIKNMGVKVDLAENGKEAVASVEKNHYDLVFMDTRV